MYLSFQVLDQAYNIIGNVFVTLTESAIVGCQNEIMIKQQCMGTLAQHAARHTKLLHMWQTAAGLLGHEGLVQPLLAVAP